MLRTGILHKHAAGIFSLLPLGKNIVDKVDQIIREEMNNTGAVEPEMNSLSPKAKI